MARERTQTSAPPDRTETDPPVRLELGLNAVIVAAHQDTPWVLTTPWEEGGEALPFGPLDAAADRTLERGLRRWVAERTGFRAGYVEQLYTFADQFRDPRERDGGPRIISVGYLVPVRYGAVAESGGGAWRSWYDYLPWEDWRGEQPALIDDIILPQLEAWCRAASSKAEAERRRERAALTFGLGAGGWNGEAVLERYELLYEIGLVAEARAGRARKTERAADPASDQIVGRPMALDHRRILATAIGRIRGKIKYRPVVFELMPPSFTLYQLQRAVEALSGIRLHKQNFRRLVETGGLVERTGDMETRTGGRPAVRFRFRAEVLKERMSPGVRVPDTRQAR